MQKNENEENIALSIIIGKNISDRRKKLQLSQKELAKKLDLTENAIISMEKGRIAPKMGRIQEIADTLECSILSLFMSADSTSEEHACLIAEKLKAFSPEIQKHLFELINTTIDFTEKTSKK